MFLAHYSRGLSGHSWKSSAKLSNTLAWSSKAVVRTIHLSLSSSSPFWQYSLPLNLSPVQIFPLPSTACAWGTQKELMSELHPHSKTKWGVPTTGRNSPTFSIWEEKKSGQGPGRRWRSPQWRSAHSCQAAHVLSCYGRLSSSTRFSNQSLPIDSHFLSKKEIPLRIIILQQLCIIKD